jgi:Concanavalin A-like lectin/glucanases superfamily
MRRVLSRLIPMLMLVILAAACAHHATPPGPSDDAAGEVDGATPPGLDPDTAQPPGAADAGIPRNGLVLYLRLDDEAPTAARDEGGGGQGAATACESVEGKVGRAFRFNGRTSQIRFPDRPELNPTTAITVAAWIRPHTGDPGGGPRVLQKGYNPADQDTQYRFMIDRATIALRLFLQGRSALIGAPLPALDEWHHVAITWDDASGNGNAYVDGVLVQTTSYHGAIGTSTLPLYIGTKHEMDGVTNWNGDLDEIALYGRALDADEVKQLAGL